MDSGVVLGLIASVAVLAQTGWLIQRCLSQSFSWRALVAHWLVIVAFSGVICGVVLLLARALNVVDSSHGFGTIGIPTIFAVCGALTALTAFAFRAVSYALRKGSHAA